MKRLIIALALLAACSNVHFSLKPDSPLDRMRKVTLDPPECVALDNKSMGWMATSVVAGVLGGGSAQGVMLWCPCGFNKPEYPLAGGRPHAVIVPFNGLPLPADFGPQNSSNPAGPRPRWSASGTDLNDLTVNPSVAVGTPECWHGWIKNGEVIL